MCVLGKENKVASEKGMSSKRFFFTRGRIVIYGRKGNNMCHEHGMSGMEEWFQIANIVNGKEIHSSIVLPSGKEEFF